VFTLPADLRRLAKAYAREIYNALFQCAAAALLEMAETRLGIRLGLTLVLHTWRRDLGYHPHIHILITAGGLTLDGKGFKRIRKKILLHVKPLAKLFKGKMMDALRKLRQDGVIQMSDGAFGTLMASLQDQDWVVYLKRTFHGPANTLQYLGRYSHRVGIANSRLLNVTEHEVTFRTKAGRTVTLDPVTFLKRFVQHVLPDKFKKIRHAGLYASPKALAQARDLLGPPKETVPRQPTWQEALLELTGRDVTRCPQCGARLSQRDLAATCQATRRAKLAKPRSPP
jgi:hypothetical protein